MISLETICSYRNEKASAASITTEDLYVSTESMGPNRGGVSRAASVPSEGKVSCFRKGDTLVSNIRPYFKKIWEADLDGYCSNDVLVFQPGQRCGADYLYWLLCDDAFFDYVMATSKGTKMPRGDKSAIMSYAIPSNSEMAQRNITSILNPIQAKIEMNAKLNGYLAAMCDTVFSEQFGSIEDNAVLSDVADITMGQSPSGKSYNEDGDGTVFYQGRGEFGWRFPSQRLFTTEPKRMAKEGDVLMSVRAPVGNLNVAYEDCCIGRGLAAIHSQYPSYCLYLMRSLGKKLDAYNGEGTVFGSINGKALNGLEIGLPDVDAIKAFEAFAHPVDLQIRANVTEERCLETLRDTLLPKLMSGEIDVSKVELPTPPNSHLSAD